ncbi:insulinase family protein [Candidatus Bathyarchaeota archaeon]|nr:insulinase family protein [Candidatus Bathyarchaeota archaeon]
MNDNLSWIRDTLPNGVTALLFPNPSNLTTQLSVVIRYGSNADSVETAGMAHFLEHMLSAGSKERIALSRAIEQMGGYVDFFTTKEYTMTTAGVLPKKLPETSRIMSKLVFNSDFESRNFEIEGKIILNEISEAHDDPWTVVTEMFLKNLFPTHPVREPVFGNPKTVKCLSLPKMKQTYHQYYVPKNVALILTGSFSDNDVETVFHDFQNTKNRTTKLEPLKHTENGKPEKELLRTKPGISQTYVTIGTQAVWARHPDVPALDLIDTLMGSGASSRLFVELCEKRALSYDVSSSHTYGSDYGYFCVNCAVEQKNLEKARHIIEQEIARIKTEPVSSDELNKGKDMIISDIYRALDNSTILLGTIAEMEVLYSNQNALFEYANKIKSISTEELFEAAKKHLDENAFSTAILTPKES